MLRRRHPILAGCCALLLLGLWALWVRTEGQGDAVVAYTGGRSWEVRTGRGCVMFDWAPAPESWHHIDYAGDGYFTRAGRAPERWLPSVQGSFTDGRLWVPLWVPMVAALGMGIRWARGRRLPMAGHCAACGYDLLHNVRGVCPECGTPVGSSQPTAPRDVDGDGRAPGAPNGTV